MNTNKIIYNLAKLLRKLGVNFNESSDRRVVEMIKEIKRIGKIEFKIEQYPDGSWTAESTNIDGIITGSTDIRDISKVIRDATFTYFEIPAHLCADSLLHSDNEPVILKQRVYA